MGWSNSNSWGGDAQEGWYKKSAAAGGSSPTVYAGGSWGGAPGFPAGDYSSSSLDLGPVTSTRYIVALASSGGATAANTAVKLGSASMAKILTIDNGTNGSATELWAVQGATGEGSSAVVTVTPASSFSVNPAGVSIVVFDNINTTISSSVPFVVVNGSANPQAIGSITIPSSGVAGFFNWTDGVVTGWNGTGVATGTINFNGTNSSASNATSSTPGPINASISQTAFVTAYAAGISFGP
jgi:hypothetical protein